MESQSALEQPPHQLIEDIADVVFSDESLELKRHEFDQQMDNTFDVLEQANKGDLSFEISIEVRRQQLKDEFEFMTPGQRRVE